MSLLLELHNNILLSYVHQLHIFVNNQLRLVRDLARNEEFSEIAVIHIFLQFSKIKHSYLWGGGGSAGKISR